MRKFFLWASLGVCLGLPELLAAAERYALTTGSSGALAVISDQVVIANDFRKTGEVQDIWFFEKTTARQGYLRLGDRRYLTANEQGEIYLTDQAERASVWGLIVPSPAGSTTRSSLSTLGGRVLDVVGKPEMLTDAKGRHFTVNRVKLGVSPNKWYDRKGASFTITAIAP